LRDEKRKYVLGEKDMEGKEMWRLGCRLSYREIREE
jgi:hypothetical protein